jgi:hypothetical protein
MEDKNTTYYVEVTTSYHPTEKDKVGCEGLYVEHVELLSASSMVALRAERDLLRRKLETAIDGLWRIDFCTKDKAVAVEILEKIATLNGKNE